MCIRDSYIVVPVIVAQLWRRQLLSHGGEVRLAATLKRIGPLSLAALLLTLVLLFGFQGEQILAQPWVILMPVSYTHLDVYKRQW